MKKVFRTLFLMLVLMLGLGLIGCSNQGKAGNQEPLQAEITVTSTPEPEKPSWTIVNDTTVTHKTNYEGFLNESFGITVGYAGEIHYTTDGGKSWPQGENKSMCRFSLDIVNEDLAWCGGNGNEIRVTKDGGETWSKVSDFAGSGYHFHISFIDDTYGWVATSKKLAATQDGGTNWKELKLPEGEKRIQSVYLRTPSDGYLLTPNGMLYTTKDGGESWYKQDLNFAQLKMVDLNNKSGYMICDNVPMADMCFTDENNGTIVLIGTVPDVGVKTWVMSTIDRGITWEIEELNPVEDFRPSSVYLSKDGQYMTLSSNAKRILVLKKEN